MRSSGDVRTTLRLNNVAKEDEEDGEEEGCCIDGFIVPIFRDETVIWKGAVSDAMVSSSRTSLFDVCNAPAADTGY